MKKMTLLGGAIVLTVVAGFSLGCGKDKPTAKDTKEFETAIAEYLKSRSYDMKVASFETLKVEGGSATAACKMQQADGLYAVSVKWDFKFERKGEAWKVAEHTAK